MSTPCQRFLTPIAFGLCLLLGARGVSAETAEPAAAEALPTRALETVEVVAEVTGPGLWALRRGDSVVWVLGVQSPLPRRFRWESPELDARLAESSLLLAPPRVDVARLNRFNAIFLMPSLIRARRDPEGLTLAERVPPEQYQRWLALKEIHFPRKRGTERWRPIIAALELFAEAVEDRRMSYRPQVWNAVERKARRLGVAIERPELSLDIGKPRALVKQFAAQPLDDLVCFERTLDRLESDLDALAERADAWAVGDVAALRNLPFRDQAQACRDALLEAQFAQEQGLDDLPRRLRSLWVDAVESALAQHLSSVAVLDIALLLDPEFDLDGALMARGIEVQAPDAAEAPTVSGPQP